MASPSERLNLRTTPFIRGQLAGKGPVAVTSANGVAYVSLSPEAVPEGPTSPADDMRLLAYSPSTARFEKVPPAWVASISPESTFLTLAAAEAANVSADVKAVRILSRDGTIAASEQTRVRVPSEPSVPSYLKHRSADRYLPDGTTSLANGGWWLIAGATVNAAQCGWKADGATDNAPVLQAIHDYYASLGAASLYVDLPPGVAAIRSQVVLSETALIVRGSGAALTPDDGAGTMLDIQITASSAFKITGLPARGSCFESLGVKQAHPAVGSGWAPTAYPPVFECINLYGEFILRDLFALGVYDLVSSINSGRLCISGLRGQIYHCVAYIEDAYDSPRITDVHDWTYRSSHASVMSWQQANKDSFILGRCDTPFFDKIFAFGARSIIRTITTTNGGPSKLMIGSMVGDFCRYGLWSTSNGFDAKIGSLVVQGETWASHGVPIPGARAIYVVADENTIQIGNLHTERHDVCAVEGVGTANTLQVATGIGKWFDMTAAGGWIAWSGTASTASVGANARLYPVNGSGLAAPSKTVLTVLQENVSTGDDRMVSFRGVGSARIQAVGPTANINAIWQSTGTGRAVLANGAGVWTICVDAGTGDTRLLARSNTGDLNLSLEGAGANLNFSLNPKGSGRVGIYGDGAQFNNDGYARPFLRVGNVCLWIDSSTRLRIKNGAPSSDTDGTVVGAQV